jgi:hypothetical protein
MKMRLDMDKIARGLGAERRGKVAASGGYFGAIQLLADIEARFRVPSGGGRPTDASWTERRLVPLAPRTLKRLEDIAAKVRVRGRERGADAARCAPHREENRGVERTRGRESRSSEATRHAVTGSATRHKISISASYKCPARRHG